MTVSFDPRETPTLASQKKAVYTQRYGRPGTKEGWHFLTGDAPAIAALTETVGFNYVYDEAEGQFVHGSAIMIVSPKGTVSHYFFGIEYPSEDIRLAVIESSEEKLGNVFDQIMLYCFNYDPEQGRYGVAIMNAMRLAGLVTLLAMGSFMVVMIRPGPSAEAGEGLTRRRWVNGRKRPNQAGLDGPAQNRPTRSDQARPARSA